MRPPRSLGSVRRPHGQMAEYGMKLADRGITLQRHLAHLYILGSDRGEVHGPRQYIGTVRHDLEWSICVAKLMKPHVVAL
ncbi:hypothetical protein HDG33_005671 [Paraburkholderia sp. Cpub6]|nr:hypothetical protein [Paraburkholderia sp. Cpub6]